jgi:hypothetical protein
MSNQHENPPTPNALASKVILHKRAHRDHQSKRFALIKENGKEM